MQQKGSSENHQVNNLKVVIDFGKYLGTLSFYDVSKKDQILSFLSRKIKSPQDDPEKKWITTWNHYLNRIKLFERWLHNYHLKKHQGLEENEEWVTPEFCRIKPKQTKRLSPYLESEIWDREELITLIKYEPHVRNKAILSLLWDLNARPHEITLLLIKSIRLKDRYGEGEIPYQTKTGSGPILLMLSFSYVRDWLNQHPFRNEPNARLICNINTGAPINPKTIWNVMNQLMRRIERLLESNQITDHEERQRLEFLLRTKKFNPYCIRHSSISSDSEYLPEYALKNKVRWSMNSKQGNRYIKKRINEKNPQTYEELKQIAKDYFFERADHLKNLNRGVKLELCNMLSDTQNILLGSPYPSGLCESFASPNPAPHIPWEDCKYIEDKSAGTTVHKAQVGSSLIVDAKLSNYQVFLGHNQTITVHVKSSMSNGAEQNAPVQVSMSDSSGRAVHFIKGKTDINGSFSHSWTIDSESPNSFYSVTVMVKDSTNQNWVSGTLYFNRNPDQTPSLRVRPWDNQSSGSAEQQ